MRRRVKESLRDLTRRRDPPGSSEENKNAELCEKCVESLIRNSSWKDDTHTHHETLQSFKDSVAQGCWICTALLTRLSTSQREILLDERTYSDALYFSFVQISDTSDPAVAGAKGAFEYHLLIAAADRIRDLAREHGTGGGGSSLYLWAQPSNSIEQRLLAIPEGDNTSGDEAWTRATVWLQNCDARHEACSRSSTNLQYPTRLLDVGDPTIQSDHVRVVESASTDMDGHYLTLSHSWGTDSFLTLRNDNLEDFKAGVLISSLSKTFRDAISITRRMSIRYIWIDSLCIVQDDPSLADWSLESVRMGQYYTNAYCNISATSSRSGSEGLFRDRNFANLKHVQCHLPSGYGRVAGMYNLFDVTLFDRHLNDAPLHRRAWVLQERLLARRVLHFCEDQLIWECHEHTASEQYPFGMPNVVPFVDRARFKDLDPRSAANQERFATKDSQKIGYSLWSRTTQEYSECYLTFARDKTRAFGGLVRLFEDLLEDECIYGCWRSRLGRDLLWKTIDMSYPAVNRLYEKAREYDDIPSWSWMSSDTPLTTITPSGTYAYALKEESFLFSVVLAPSRNDNGTNESTLAAQRTVLLRCFMLPAELCLDHWGRVKVHFIGEADAPAGIMQYINMDRQLNELKLAGDRMTIFVAPMRRFVEKNRGGASSKPQLECLLLRASNEKQYKRLGFMHVEGKKAVRAFSNPTRNDPNLSSWAYDEKTSMHTISLI